MPSSLYHTWKKIVTAASDRTALTDAKSGKNYTFAQLDALSTEPNPFPCGNDLTFITQILANWKHNLHSCPLEPNSPTPHLTNIPDHIAHIKSTSGSTGIPRFILFTAAQLAADAHNIVSTMGLNQTCPNIGVISMAHSYGFSNLVLPLLLHGIPLILAADPLPGSLQRALALLPPTGGTLPAVPAMWRAWLRADCLHSTSIKIAISAGAPLTTDLESAIFSHTAIKVHNFYGSSECGGIAYDQSSTPRTNPNTVGTPLNNVTVRLNTDHCLQIHSPAVGTTYWPHPDPSSLTNQQFTTQDLAAINSDREITLLGRASDIINIAGRKLDPATIETELLKHPDVDHCLVFGTTSSDTERVQEIVAITNAGDPADLKSHLSKKLPSWQKVRHWWITTDLKPNSRGKLSRAEWHQRWQTKSSADA